MMTSLSRILSPGKVFETPTLHRNSPRCKGASVAVLTVFRRFRMAPFVVAAWLVVSTGQAEVRTWTGNSNSAFFTASNWVDGAGAPGSNNDMVVSGAPNTLTIQISRTGQGDSQIVTVRDVSFSVTSGDFLFRAGGQPDFNTFNANSWSVAMGANVLTIANFTSQDLDLNIATDFTVNSAVVFGGRSETSTNNRSAIQNFVVGGTTYLNSNGVISLSHIAGVVAGEGPGRFDLGVLEIDGGILNMTIGTELNGQGTPINSENTVRVSRISGASGQIRSGKNDTNGHLIIYGDSGSGSFGGTIDDFETNAVVRVTKDGDAVQELSGENTYSGGTTINSGTLRLTGSGLAGTGDIAIAGASAVLDVSGYTDNSNTYILGADQTLSGIGTVLATGMTLQVNGSLAPGNSIGQLTIDGGMLDISGVGILEFEVGAIADSILFVNGAGVDLGTLNFSDFDFIAVAGFGAGEYTLLDGWSTLSGGLGIETEGLIDGFAASLAIDGNSLVLTVVPEPAHVAGVLGLLVLLVALRAGKRRRM